MLVGEYNLPRQEFLYEIRYWEALLIIRGRRKQGRLEQQLLRLTAYFSCFANRENKGNKTPPQWLPLPWEGELEENPAEPITEEDTEDLLALINEANAQHS